MAQSSAPYTNPTPTNETVAQELAKIATYDHSREISELTSLVAAAPKGTASASGAASCQCLAPGLWCGTRSGNDTLNAIVNGDFNHTDYEDGPDSQNETHHGVTWNDTKPENYPHDMNATHHDGNWNGTDSEDHHNKYRLQTLNGTCDLSTIYYCPEDSAPALNSLPCSQSQGKTKRCRELSMSFYDVCV